MLELTSLCISGEALRLQEQRLEQALRLHDPRALSFTLQHVVNQNNQQPWKFSYYWDEWTPWTSDMSLSMERDQQQAQQQQQSQQQQLQIQQQPERALQLNNQQVTKSAILLDNHGVKRKVEEMEGGGVAEST